MTAFIPKFEFLGNCKAGELVRLKEGDDTRWGIMCGLEGHFVVPVLIMSPTEVKTVNIMEGGAITGDFDRIPVLVYGTHYTIEPDHTGQIDLAAAEISKIPGRSCRSRDDSYLADAVEL